MVDFWVREGDVLCRHDLTHRHTVEKIDGGNVAISFDGGERRTVSRQRMYDALAEGTVMVLERAAS